MKLILLKGKVAHEDFAGKFLDEHQSEENTNEQNNENKDEFNLKKLKIDYDEETLKPKKRLADKRKKCAIETFSKYLQEGEEIKNHKFGVTTATREDVPKDCPVLNVKTNLAEYLLIFNEYEFKNGVVSNEVSVENNVPAKIMLGNPLLMFFAKELAKEEDANLKKELGKLKDDLGNMLHEFKLEEFTDKVIAVRGWLRDEYSMEQVEYTFQADADKSPERIKEVRDNLKHRLEPLSDIVNVIESKLSEESLKNCDYLTRSRVMLYASAAALRAILLKEEIFWDKEYSRLTKQKYARNREDVFNNFKNQVRINLTNYIDRLRKGRYEKVWGIDRKSERHCGGYNVQICDYSYWYEWGDEFSSKSFPNDPFKGDRIDAQKFFFKDKGKDENENAKREEAQKKRDDHFNEVKRLFEQHIENPLNEIHKRFSETNLLN
jgi:hypothetical protein